MRRLSLPLMMILFFGSCFLESVNWHGRIHYDHETGAGSYWGEKGRYQDDGYGAEIGLELNFKTGERPVEKKEKP